MKNTKNLQQKKCEKHPTVANLEELESAAVLGRVHSKGSMEEAGNGRKSMEEKIKTITLSKPP